MPCDVLRPATRAWARSLVLVGRSRGGSPPPQRVPCQNHRVSPKSRGRKNKKTTKRADRPRRGSSAATARAGRPLSAPGFGAAGRRTPAANSPWPDLQQFVAAGIPALYALAERFRPLLIGDDPLLVEETTAELIAQADQADDTSGLGLAMGTVALAARHPEPHVAAMACALHAFMPGMATGMAISDLARRGVPMPSWRDQLGSVVPGPTWRYLDRYGEQRAVLATFRYGQTPHTLTAVTSPWPVTRVLTARLLRADGDELRQSIIQNIEQRHGGPVVEEPLTPQELCGNLRVALYRVADDLDSDSQVALAILRQRLKTLPPPARTNPRRVAETGAQPAELADAARGRARRDAAVAAFLSATSVPAGVDDAVLGFWARVLAGAAAVHPVAPTHVSSAWLGYLLEQYVPQTIELPAAARAGLRPAVTAWAHWTAGQRSLPADALEALTTRVTELDEAFEQHYADPEMIALRCYLRDVVTTTVDGDDLRRVIRSRGTAPRPATRRPAPAGQRP
jgi:hypothetical protein